MVVRTTVALVSAGFLCLWFLQPVCGRETKPPIDQDTAKLVGRWAILQTKEPGKPYLESYKGRPFVAKGHNAFSLIIEYRKDGTFRRISIVDGSEAVEEGQWRLSGHELRHKRNRVPNEEVLYVRFDSPQQLTIIEVYEETRDPGLFARFKKIE
jgi:hypothetical protein